MSTVSREELQYLVVHEARLLDARQYEEWNRLFADDGFYWVPLVPEQADPLNHASHMYEDKLLRELRIERLKSPRAFSQQPPSRCHHLLQQPSVEVFAPDEGRFATRTEFHYTESRGDDILILVGTAHHQFVIVDGQPRISLKRVDLLNPDAALPAIQLFI